MSDLFLFYKPYQVLSQFTDDKGRTTLAEYIKTEGIYPAGRLDYDSEGLLLLTGDGELQARITHPEFKLPKTYWVQVEGQITDEALTALSNGVELNDGKTRPARARHMKEPKLPPRSEPVSPRPGKGTSWLEITLIEGRNRQVRRMTAHVGFPTLRLIRWSIGTWTLEGMKPGQIRQTQVHLPTKAHKVALKPRKKGVKKEQP
ncbi:pseudouridine synthase [Marinospirillum alkaliphilum]|uniref:23S rRNA pseudouridine2457 synthase n=1 Tax=Marinospirillum alkaliphilum DSM 21637 TaxID=1122209 RepID=A0A1K1TSV5_9GAMM|nr:pseudouridine synthase [Marinospirillum alkaliphilum]SFX03873.1 23S rRNA pseudouridine2457 synthase [Marinospirillum alkaliphilum DSM 21637]